MFPIGPQRSRPLGALIRSARGAAQQHARTCTFWLLTVAWVLTVAAVSVGPGAARGQQRVFSPPPATAEAAGAIQQPADLGGAELSAAVDNSIAGDRGNAFQPVAYGAFAAPGGGVAMPEGPAADPLVEEELSFGPAVPARGPVRRSFHHLGQWLRPHAYQPASPRQTWLYRPYSVGWFAGELWGGAVIDDWVSQRQGFVGGIRLGWDADAFWGLEMRCALGELALVDSQRAVRAQQTADDMAGLAEDDPLRLRFDRRRELDLFLWDVNLMFYPLGDTRLRPFAMIGLGTARVSFKDRLSNEYDEIVLGMPVGGGLKWRLNDWLALRCTLSDNIALSGGSGMNTLHELSLTGEVEVRFGGSRRTYWPWNPGKFYW